MKELTLNDLAQSRGPGQLHDSKFMSAAEKTQSIEALGDVFEGRIGEG